MNLRGRSAVLALGVGMLGLACAPRPKVVEAPVLAAPSAQTLVGILDLVIGDPRNPGGERVSASLVEQGGKRTTLMITRGQLDSLGPAVRQPGTKVRVTGEAVTEGGIAGFRVATIAIVAP
jgi:hypothetical protein